MPCENPNLWKALVDKRAKTAQFKDSKVPPKIMKSLLYGSNVVLKLAMETQIGRLYLEDFAASKVVKEEIFRAKEKILGVWIVGGSMGR